MTGLTFSPADARWERRGVLIGACFCLAALANQAYIGTQMAPVIQGLSRDLVQAIVFWFAVLSILAHLFLWTIYAALVTAVARVCFDDSERPALFRHLFQCAGWAHVPLLVWALGVSLAWYLWGGSPESANLHRLLSFYSGTRLGGYVAGIALMTILLSTRHRTTVMTAIIVAGLPAAGMWLGLALMNGVAGVLAGGHVK